MSVMTRVGTKLSSLLAEDLPAAGRRADDKNEPFHVSRAQFHRHLAALLRGDGLNKPLAGRVNFVGLTKIRDKLGPRWTHIAERADEITRKAIERRLTDADMYTRYEELHYVIVFAQLGKEQAQLKCALIAEEIAKRLLGEDVDPELLEVKTVVPQPGGELKFEDVPSADVLARRLAESEAAAKQDPTLPDMTAGRAGTADEDAWWDTKVQNGPDPLAGVQFVYRPMWDAKRNAVTTYLCLPAIPAASGHLTVGETEMPALEEDAIHRLDLLIQRQVISDLRKLIAANQRMLLCLPVHFATLASHARRSEYMALCQRGLPQQGIKLLAFELTGVPCGVPSGRLLEISAALRRFGRGVLLRTTIDQTHFRPPGECGISGVGFRDAAHGVPEWRQIQDMDRFAVAAKKAGLVAYVHGLRSMSLTTAAIAAGFDFVDGDVIKSVVERPSTAYSFDVADLFACATA
jgi:hypothetical protein